MADDSRIQELDEMFRKARSVKDRLTAEWFLNVAYYEGEQWVFWNHGRIDKPRLEDWRVTLVDNRIMPVVFSRVARKLKSRPVFISTPFSYDEEDLNASEVATKVLDFDWTHLGLVNRLLKVMMWSEVCGAGFWKIYWDSTKGDKKEYLFDASGQPILGSDQRPIEAEQAGDMANLEGIQVKKISRGDVQIDVISPFEFYPDPVAESLDECEFIIEEKVRSKEYLIERYGEKAKDLKEDTDVPVGIAEGRMFPGFATPATTGQYRAVTTREFWAKPSSKYAKGKHCVWAGQTILREQDAEEAPFDGSPYVMFSGVEVPGRFWPSSVTTQLRGPQTELNKIKSQIRENAIRIGNPALLASRQANIEYAGLPGERVNFDATVPDAVPSYLQPPEMPGYVQNEVERIESSIQEISGLHEVSKASVPSGVTAASAINLLQEADDTRLGPEITAMEDALGKAGTKDLRLRAKYQEDERLLQIAGEDGEWDIIEFRGTMIKPNINVDVQTGSGLPRSKAAKQAAMVEVFQLAVQYGVEMNPRDLRKFFKDYELGGLEHLFATLSGDELQIKREHNIMMRGEAIDINDWDEDDTHIEGHNELRKSARYGRASEEARAALDAHVMAHQERRAQVIEQEAMAAQTQIDPTTGQPVAMNGGQMMPAEGEYAPQ